MTVGTHHTRFQQGIIRGFYEYRDDAMVQRLQEIISDIAIETDKGKSGALWKTASMTLAKTSYDPLKAARVIGDRNVEGLARVVEEIAVKAKALKNAPPAAVSAPAAAAKPVAAPTPAPVAVATPAAPPTFDELKSALRAFKKRLKVTRLDDESAVSSRALTGGRKSGIVAITPPHGFTPAVWETLAKEGKIKRAGSGMYELVGE